MSIIREDNNAFDEIELWAGQRKLMPSTTESYDHYYRCRKGKGFLRAMSQAEREIISPGKEMTFHGNEVITITSLEDMKIEIVYKKRNA